MEHQDESLPFNNLASDTFENDQCLAYKFTSIANFSVSLPEDMPIREYSQNNTEDQNLYSSTLSGLSAVTNFIEKNLSPSNNIAEEISKSINELNKFTGDYVTLENALTIANFAAQGYLSFQIGGLNIALLAAHLGLSIAQPYIDSYWQSYVDGLEAGNTKDILSSIKLGKFLTLVSSTQLGISNGIKAYSLLKDSSLLANFLTSNFGQYITSLPVLKSMTFSHFQSITAKPISVLFTDELTNKFKPIFWGMVDGALDYAGYPEFTPPEVKLKPADYEKTVLDMVKKAPEIVAKSHGLSMPVYIAAGETLKELWYNTKEVIKKNDFTSVETYKSIFTYKTIENTRDFLTNVALKGIYETAGRKLAPQYSVNHVHSGIYLSTKEFFKVSESTYHNKFCKTHSCWKAAYYLTGWQYNEDLDNLEKVSA